MSTNVNDPFASQRCNSNAVTMEVNGLKAILNMPKAREKRKDAEGNEVVQGLPEYNQRPAFVVDEYPACPDSWMHGSGVSSSYFVPIKSDHGMWLDFTMNSYHKHDVAVVPSIQGVNPLTGMKSDPIRLEQYRDMCPKHQKEFKQDRFCEECKYKHHPQNYLCSNNGSAFWIDGFRSEDGTIRQWYFTEEECKGVAAQIIGDERVFAIGLAFYLSKEPKPVPTYNYNLTACSFGSPSLGGAFCSGTSWNTITNTASSNTGSGWKGFGSTSASNRKRRTSSRGPNRRLLTRNLNNTRPLDEVAVNLAQADVASTQKMLEIGAGAKISQRINPDPQQLDYWQEEPAGFIYVNYCDIQTAQKIIAAGKRSELEEGFLSGLNTK